MANAFHPFPYQSKQDPLLHSGLVSVTNGVLSVNLGIGHNNFVPTMNIKGAAVEDALDLMIDWQYTPNTPGSFDILIYKRPATYGAWVVDTGTRTVGFNVIADASVS